MIQEVGPKNPAARLDDIGLGGVSRVYWNQSPQELVDKTIELGQGELADSQALVVNTGEFTGRSPKDRFIVKDSVTENTVDWNHINIGFEPEKFDQLYKKIAKYLEGKEIYVRDAYVCADDRYRTELRVINEHPWQNLFAYNMFLKPNEDEIRNADPSWHVIAAPGFRADPAEDGTRQHNFAVINFSKKIILIGGTAYTGEIKKGMFSVLNYILPHEEQVLSMHCSANVGAEGDTAVFFGLSGTGKTTLSADPDRKLIGDDEHGWANNSVFNFEGGCYAKTINLSAKKEPQIYDAIKQGAILENVCFHDGGNTVNFDDSSITENTRVSYPIDYIDNIQEGSQGAAPQNIFFLTCDASGVLPPIARLSPGQAMYQFISGYTAKVAGTEAGITEPTRAFSACFGAPFLPLHPTKYAEMLGEKMRASNVKIWLVNTGWTGGAYGVGSRMKLSHTRAMITAALRGELNNVSYHKDTIFGLEMPESCPGVPPEILDPKNTWENKSAYEVKATELGKAFIENFEKYAALANEETKAAEPKVSIGVSN